MTELYFGNGPRPSRDSFYTTGDYITAFWGLDRRIWGAAGALLASLVTAQGLLGCMAGVGWTWGNGHRTNDRYSTTHPLPNFTLGSSYVYARAGKVLHVHYDAEIKSGCLLVDVVHTVGLVSLTHIPLVNKSGAGDVDVPIAESGLYNVNYIPTSCYGHFGSMNSPIDMTYQLSWSVR